MDDQRRRLRGKKAALVAAALALLAAWWWSRRAGQASSAEPARPPPARAIKISPEQRAAPPAAAERGAPAVSAPAARPPAPRVEAGPAGGAIEGRVVSAATGQPVEGAELTFQRDDGANSVRSGAGGAYSFTPGSPGRYRLATVSADGFLPFAPAWGHSPLTVSLAAGQRIRGVDVRLTPAVEYTCQVVAPGGAPVAGAEVSVLGAASGEFALLPLSIRATTDPRGEARLRAPSGAIIEARRQGFAPGRANIDFAAELGRRVVLRLGRNVSARAGSARIAGRVTDDAGAPVAGALVLARHDWERGAIHAPAESSSGPDGAFVLTGLDEGTYEMEARAEGYARDHLSEVAAGKLDVVLKLRAGGRVRGRVTDARSGRPVSSFTVLVSRKFGQLRLELEASRAFADGNGEYELAGLAEGPASVSVAAPGFAASDEVSVIIGTQPARADASLRPGPRLSGIVLERGTRKPMPAAHVGVEGRRADIASPALQVSSETDDAGRFVLAGLPRGALSLFVTAPGHHARIAAVPELRGDADPPPVEVLLTPLASGEEPSFELTGIGAVMSAEGDALVVRQVMEGGGAAEAGLRAGDRIVEVDGRSVIDLGFEAALSTIRGPEGSSVVLAVRRAEAPPLPTVVWRRLIRG